MKKYILNQLTQVSAWIGVVLIICAFFAPRSYIICLGVALILTHDEALKNWVVKRTPWLEKTYSDIEKAFEENGG